MRALLLLCWIWLIGLSLPTQAQNRGFAIGPVISFDESTSKIQNGYLSRIKYIDSFSYGVDVSYLANRVLIDVQLLTLERRYDALTDFKPVDLQDPFVLSRIRISARSYTLPVTFSYRFNKSERLQLFAGVGAIAEWVPGTFERQSFDVLNRNSSIVIPTDASTGNNFVVGVSLQAKARYHLNHRLLIQLEPTLRYFPDVKTPYVSGSRTGISGLLTVAYKIPN